MDMHEPLLPPPPPQYSSTTTTNNNHHQHTPPHVNHYKINYCQEILKTTIYTTFFLQISLFLGSYTYPWSETVFELDDDDSFIGGLSTTIYTADLYSNLNIFKTSQAFGPYVMMCVFVFVVPLSVMVVFHPCLLLCGGLLHKKQRGGNYGDEHLEQQSNNEEGRSLLEMQRQHKEETVTDGNTATTNGMNHQDPTNNHETSNHNATTPSCCSKSPSCRLWLCQLTSNQSSTLLTLLESITKMVFSVSFLQGVLLEANSVTFHLGGFVANVVTYTRGGLMSFVLAGTLGISVVVLLRIHSNMHVVAAAACNSGGGSSGSLLLLQEEENQYEAKFSAAVPTPPSSLFTSIPQVNTSNNNNNNNDDDTNITPPITTPSIRSPTIPTTTNNNNNNNTLTWNTISITLTLLSTLLLYPLFTKPLLQFQYTGVESTFLSTPIVRDVSFLQIAINLYTNTPNKLFAIPNTLLFWSHVVIFPIVALLLCWILQMCSRNTKRVSILVGMLQCIAPFCNVAMFAMSAGVASQNMERISTFLFDENALCQYLQNHHQSIMEGQECLVVHGMVLPGLLYALMQGFMVEILMRMMINEFQVKKEDGGCSGESL